MKSFICKIEHVNAIFCIFQLLKVQPIKLEIKPYSDMSQCAPGIFNLDQKFHGIFCFRALIYMREFIISQKNVIGLPKFAAVNMARKCPHMPVLV